MLLIYLPNIVSAQWDTGGNSGLPEGVKNFLGTHDNVSVRFITNNIERMRLSPNGNFGIGTNNPQQLLHVNGAIRFQNLSSGTQTTALMIDANGDLSKRTLHTVAFSGSYNDLTNLPSLNIANWNTAFSWGNHATAGYLTSYTETDPVFIASPSCSISSSDITNWNTAHSWGNHAGLYRIATWVPTWDEVTDKPSFATVAISGDYNDLINTPNIFDGNWSSLTGTAPAVSTFNNDAGYITDADDADADPTNEIQDLQLNGNILTITQNGTATEIDLSQYLDNTDTQLSEAEVINMVSNNGFITSPNDGDADPTNEIQDLSINAEFLSISGGSGVSLDGINYWSRLNSNLYYNNGSVGIGINEPNKLLHLHSESTYFPGGDAGPVVGNSNPMSLKGRTMVSLNSESTLLLTNKNSGSEATDGLLIRSYNNNATISLQEEGSLSLITKNPLRFKMQQNGNISIGTHNTNYFTVNENGNVGVGTNEPAAKLHVKGDKIIIERNQKYIHINASNPNAEIGSSTGELKFWYTGVGYNNIFCKDIISYGNVGIGLTGTEVPQFELDVRGTGHFCEVRVGTEDWCDYVFADDYILPNLENLETFIKQNKHLPGIPNEAEVIANGIDLGEMNKKLLEKVEELTLIIIEQDKQMKEQGERINKLEEANKTQ